MILAGACVRLTRNRSNNSEFKDGIIRCIEIPVLRSGRKNTEQAADRIDFGLGHNSKLLDEVLGVLRRKLAAIIFRISRVLSRDEVGRAQGDGFLGWSKE